MQPETERDLCSPSQLTLRYHCPGSVRLQLSMISSGNVPVSEEASEGLKKHDLCQEYFNTPGCPDTTPEDVVWVLDQAHEQYKEYAELEGTIVVKEYQIDLSDLGIHGGTEGCRIDLLFVIPGRKALIIDWKFGIGYVPQPKYNWQMKAYAAGVFRAFGVIEIQVMILQPNTSDEYRIKMGYFYAEDISEFEKGIREIVAKTKDENAPLVRGEHCVYGFCKARDICPLWRNAFLELPQHVTMAAHVLNISPKERAVLYENLRAAESFCNKARSTIEAIAINDSLDIEGYEIGEGKKSRAWGKPNETIEQALRLLSERCQMGFPIYQIISPAIVEKIAGKSKKVKEIIDPLIIYTPGKPSLKKKKEE